MLAIKTDWFSHENIYLKDAEVAGSLLYLADVILSSNRLPPLLTDSQFFVLEYVRTSSGLTGIELTRLMDGKNENESLREFSIVIQRLDSINGLLELKKNAYNLMKYSSKSILTFKHYQGLRDYPEAIHIVFLCMKVQNFVCGYCLALTSTGPDGFIVMS